MDLLLTHGYFVQEDPKELQIMKPYVPLGILYLCSHLRAKGFAVEIFDTTFSSRDELSRLLQETKPSVLGIYANLMTRTVVVEILKVAKQTGWKTVVGGPEPGSYAREYLAAGADVVVNGEGEITMQELLPALREDSKAALERVNGITFVAGDGSMRQTPPRAQIADLDMQPWPARESVKIEQYLAAWRKHHGQASVSVITARGCPYRCKWCSHQVYGNTHRRRSPAFVVDEVQWLIGRYQPDLLWIADDVFTIHHGWLKDYAAEMKRRGLRIPFECISRADRLNAQVVDMLAELGCFRLWVGSESGSQRILDAMERGVRVEQVRESVGLLKSRGIQTGMFLMWGYDGEELEDIEATIQHVKNSDPDIFFTTVSYPIKGTPYYVQVEDRVIRNVAWEKSSDREFRVEGQRPRGFYQAVDRLLRDEVELKRRMGKEGANPNEGEIVALRAQIERERATVYAGWRGADV